MGGPRGGLASVTLTSYISCFTVNLYDQQYHLPTPSTSPTNSEPNHREDRNGQPWPKSQRKSRRPSHSQKGKIQKHKTKAPPYLRRSMITRSGSAFGQPFGWQALYRHTTAPVIKHLLMHSVIVATSQITTNQTTVGCIIGSVCKC